MYSQGIMLLNGNLTGSSATTPQQWLGGRSAITIAANQYGPGGVQLQLLSPNGSWVPVASSFISNQVFPFDAPPGQYQLLNAAGSSIAVAAALTRTPY